MGGENVMQVGKVRNGQSTLVKVWWKVYTWEI